MKPHSLLLIILSWSARLGLLLTLLPSLLYGLELLSLTHVHLSMACGMGIWFTSKLIQFAYSKKLCASTGVD